MRVHWRKNFKKYGEPCPEALVESALSHVEILRRKNFENFKLKY